MLEMSPEDRQKAEEAQKKSDKYHDKLALAYGEIFRSAAGQFCLRDLRERCNVDVSCLHGESAASHPDPNAVLFQEGKRAVFNHINTYVRRDNERRKCTE